MGDVDGIDIVGTTPASSFAVISDSNYFLNFWQWMHHREPNTPWDFCHRLTSAVRKTLSDAGAVIHILTDLQVKWHYHKPSHVSPLHDTSTTTHILSALTTTATACELTNMQHCTNIGRASHRPYLRWSLVLHAHSSALPTLSLDEPTIFRSPILTSLTDLQFQLGDNRKSRRWFSLRVYGECRHHHLRYTSWQ